MTELLNFLIEHGYAVIFAWVALDQAGLPLPAVPLMLAAGVLVGMGQMSLLLVLLTVLLASVPIDLFWHGVHGGGECRNSCIGIRHQWHQSGGQLRHIPNDNIGLVSVSIAAGVID